jgi:Na+-driven multidrug efflux pump
MAVVQCGCCYMFIIQFQWGILGAALATNIVYFGNMIIQDFWISIHAEGQFKDMWLTWAKTTTDGLGIYLEFSVPSAVMEIVSTMSLELLVLISGYGIVAKSLPSERNDFTAMTVTMNVFSLLYIVPQGVSYSISAVVGSL